MSLRIRVHERLNESYNPKTCKIGSQVWAAENLNVDDGGEGIYKHNGETYYTWDAAMRVAKRIPGWHLPSKQEFEQLINACGGKDVAGSRLKSRLGWYYGGNGTNEYGFSAFPAGVVRNGDKLYFTNNYANFWSTTQFGINSAYHLLLTCYNGDTYMNYEYKDSGFLVRLIKD